MSEEIQRLPDRVFFAVVEDGIELAKKSGKFEEFKQDSIQNMEQRVPGLGRYLQNWMNETPTPERADEIFETCHITFELTQNSLKPPV